MPRFLPRLGRQEPEATAPSAPVPASPAPQSGLPSEQERMRRAGDDIQARAATFDAAVPFLRLALVHKSLQPPGDVAYPGPIAETMEMLALDAGESVRYVSEALLGRWGASREQAFDVADRNSIAIPLDIKASESHPALHTMAPRDGSPYAGALLRHLLQLDPPAMGMFGVLVNVPNPRGLAYVTLDPSAELRMLLANVAVDNIKMASGSKTPIDKLPWWLRPDGALVRVAFRFEDNIGVSGSHERRFEGVLVTLAPLEMLPVAPWARTHMSPADYTRFAGCVMAASGITAEQVSELGDGLALPVVAARCLTALHGEWPALVADHMAEARREIDVAEASLRAAVLDPESTRRHLVAWLGQKEGSNPKLVTRPLGATGLCEVLAVDSDGRWQALEADALPGLGEPAALFAAAEEAVARDLTVVRTLQLISGDAVGVEGGRSPTAAIPRLLALFPSAVGPAGALVAVGEHAPLRVAAAARLVGRARPAKLDRPRSRRGRGGGVVPAANGLLGGPGPAGGDTDRHARRSGDADRAIDRPGRPGGPPPCGAPPIPPDSTRYSGPRGPSSSTGSCTPSCWSAYWHRRPTPSSSRTTRARDGDFVPESGSRPVAGQDRRGFRGGGRAPARARPADARTGLRDGQAHTDSARRARERYRQRLARNVGGGLALYPVLGSGRRHRRVTHVMLERWGVDAERVRQDAAANTAAYPSLVDEPMFEDQPLVRRLGAFEVEMEAAGLFLTFVGRDQAQLHRLHHARQCGPLHPTRRPRRSRTPAAFGG